MNTVLLLFLIFSVMVFVEAFIIVTAVTVIGFLLNQKAYVTMEQVAVESEKYND